MSSPNEPKQAKDSIVANRSSSRNGSRNRSSSGRMVMKTVDGALPVFEMRRDSDADFEDGVERESDATEDEARRESEAHDEAPGLEEPDDDDEYDDVGTAEVEESKTALPASLAATPPPALPSSASMIAIKHKNSRAMKRAESEIMLSTSPSEDLDSSAADDGGVKRRRKKNTGDIPTSPGGNTGTTRRSSSSKRGSKRDNGSTAGGAPLPPELPNSNGENGQGDLPAPLPAPLPPPPESEAPVSPSKRRGTGSGGLPSPLPSSRSSDAIIAPRVDQGSTEEDDEPPPMLSSGSSTLPDEISNISFSRRTSLAMDGFSTLRDSLDGSEGSSSLTGSPGDGKRTKTLRRRQSSKTGSSGAIRGPKVRMGAGSEGTSANGSTAGSTPPRRSVAQSRPRMMDGILRIVKSMYEPDVRASMDGRIFVIEAKEYPENVVYVEEDDEGTEDYSIEFPAIKAATVEKLVLGLTPEAYSDPDFNFAFLLSFHSFTTPQMLCELLRCRWTIPKPQKPSKTGVTVDDETFTKKKLTPIRLRIINVIKLWLDEHRKALDNDARSAIEKFIEETIKPDMAGAAGTLLRVLKESTESKDEQIMFDEKPPKPYLPMNVKTKLSLLDIHPEEIARQITLIDSNLYRKIKPGEFLHSGWTKSDKEARSPGILAMINSFNVVSRWVSTQILMQQDLKQRAIMLNRVICIAQHCYEYNNFNGVMEIIASLHNSSIHRLYNTWDMLPQKSWDMFESLSLLMNSNAGEGNFFLYRNALRKIVPPLVPYLGVYLTDLIFLNDGNKDFADDAKKLVNFHKMAKIARVVRTITTHQQTPYCLTPVEFIQDFILKGPMLTDDQQYVESCKLEKKVPKSQRAQQQANSKAVKKIKVDFKALNITDD